MRLRNLQIKDIPLILEWMKDPSINIFFRFDPSTITVDSVEAFVIKANEDMLNKHYAIVNEEDEYLGTVSLKNIDYQNMNAEYAISLRTRVIGKGIAIFATNKVLDIAFDELNLNKIYLNVLANNIRAIKFYEKIGFQYEGEFRQHIKIDNQYRDLKWYSILKNSYKRKEG